jgi:hypothetical protein
MKQACAKEIGLFCPKVPHGHARVIRCLQENKGRKDFGKACREEVARYEQTISKDYRLNYRLYRWGLRGGSAWARAGGLGECTFGACGGLAAGRGPDAGPTGPGAS